MTSPPVPEMQSAVRAAETAPSQTAPNEPTLARVVGLIGCMLIALGFAVIFMNEVIGPRLLQKPVGVVAIAIGLMLQLLHALRDGDLHIRRAYGAFGYLLLVLLVVLPIPNGANFLKYGWGCALAGLLFLLTCCRHETDPAWHRRILYTLGGVGAALAGIGFLAGIVVEGFMLTYGSLLALLGLAYLCAFVSQTAPAGDAGHKAGLAMGATAVFVIIYAVLRSAIPPLLKMNLAPFFVPTGLLLMALGAVYGAIALGIVSNRQYVVLTRRELSEYFYSPIAYIVMLGVALLGALAYWIFLNYIVVGAIRFEPIVLHFYSVFPPYVVIFLVPAITMRLLSEEKRSGTYEVLLCAPVTETAVVLSKFFACLIFFMLLWGIWSLYLIGLRMEVGKEFDYRPILSFYLALVFSGAGFIGMGLFFSSLSKNQVVAGVMTFVGMLVLFIIYFLQQQETIAPIWRALFRRLTFYGLWDAALRGRLMVRDMVLQGSFAFFWLFLTVKVLEARRWS